MSTPEPVDEFAPGGLVEIRGGDHPSDYVPSFITPGDYLVQPELPFDEDDGTCDCGDE